MKNEGPASLAKRRSGRYRQSSPAVTAYLDTIDREESLALSALARLIIARTQYIDHSTLMEHITRALTSFLEEASRDGGEEPLCLYMGHPEKTVGSEHWLITLLLPLLLKYNKLRPIHLITQKEIPKLLEEGEGNLRFFMIDDIIYSGHHLAFTLETLWMEETKRKIEMAVVVAGATTTVASSSNLSRLSRRSMRRFLSWVAGSPFPQRERLSKPLFLFWRVSPIPLP